MTPLKTLRHDLGDHIADSLDIAHAALGKQINPPAVVIEPGFPYIESATYGSDKVVFRAFLIAPAGDKEAVVDALDDLIDLIRPALLQHSYIGQKYGYREVSGQTVYGDKDFPAVMVTIETERECY